MTVDFRPASVASLDWLDAAAAPAPVLRKRRRVEERLVFLISAAAYIAGAAVLVFRYQSILSDAAARVGLASSMIFSNDPHLGAIGFVWGPIPTMSALPFVALKAIWPALVHEAFAGNLVSALFMAGAVVQFRGVLADQKTPRVSRLVLTALFALHPMIVYYGINGMSEAALVCFLMVAVRYLLRWLDDAQTGPLVVAGAALAGAYLTRYEAMFAGLAATGLVATIGYLRASGSGRQRRRLAQADAAIVAFPFAFAVVVWAFASWLIVGHPFEHFSSAYGNTSQARVLGAGSQQVTGTGVESAAYLVRQLLGLAPLLPILVVVALAVALRRRDQRPLVALMVMGMPLAFQATAFLDGKTIGFLRYYVITAPFAALLAACLAAPAPRTAARRLSPSVVSTSGRSRLRLAALATAALVFTGAAIPTAASALGDLELAREEAWQLRRVMNERSLTAAQRRERLGFRTEKAVAEYIDSLNLPPGSVLIDFAFGFPVFLRSRLQKRFVITSDREFDRALARPASSGIRYMLVVPDERLGTLDVINRTYPGIYRTGGGFGPVVKEIKGSGGGFDWRVVQIVNDGPASLRDGGATPALAGGP